MAGRQLGRVTAKVLDAARPAAVKRRATDFAKKLKAEYEAGLRDEPPPELDPEVAEEVAEAMRKVDWASVRAATGQRTAEASQAARAMAAQVDWAKVQPVAGQVSSALIAAVASGQLSLGGRLGAHVARAIMNDQGLAQKVGATLKRTPSQMPPDFRGVIETTGREVPGSG